MTRIEQFMYTTATSPGAQSGYQVVARSAGITDKTISDLVPYMLPAGIDYRNFKKSKSMVVIRRGTHVAYSLTRNIGRGPDGRPDAMSNHTLVININDFKGLSYDTRYLDPFFTDFVPRTPLLQPVDIAANVDVAPDRDFVRAQTPLLTRTLHALMRGKGVAVRGSCGEQFVQTALGLLPPPLRLVPFSTCSVDLRQQPAYRFVLLNDSSAPRLPNGYQTVDAQSHLPLTRTVLGRTVRYMVAMASVGDPHIAALHAEFDKLTTLSSRKRLAVLTAVLRIAQSPKPQQHPKDLEMIVDCFAELDSSTWKRIMFGLGQHMSASDQSNLIRMIESRHAQHIASNCDISRPSIETLLAQSNTSETHALLSALYESKKSEIDDKIDQLFEDFSYSYMAKDFFKFVALTPSLACRVKEYVIMSDKNPFRRQAAVRAFVMASLESNSSRSIEPAIFRPFDLSKSSDLDSFESLFSSIFSSGHTSPASNFSVAVATAGLSYMAGFGRSYIPAPSWPFHYRSRQFTALADRLGKAAMVREPASDDRLDSKVNGRITRLLRECGITVPPTGD